jgi:hypothetical protein
MPDGDKQKRYKSGQNTNNGVGGTTKRHIDVTEAMREGKNKKSYNMKEAKHHRTNKPNKPTIVSAMPTSPEAGQIVIVHHTPIHILGSFDTIKQSPKTEEAPKREGNNQKRTETRRKTKEKKTRPNQHEFEPHMNKSPKTKTGDLLRRESVNNKKQ